MRVFAGPNGSGKTTMINKLKNLIPFGVYINADDIEKTLFENKFIDFNEFKITSSTADIQKFFKTKAFSPKKINIEDLWNCFYVSENRLFVEVSNEITSYISADIAEYIREKLLESNISFSYETVMSHVSKLEFLQKAIEKDYRVYLYFIATEDPEININRVNIRVAFNGHSVSPDIIRSRYYRSLGNLKNAIKFTSRAYIFDNSGKVSVLIAEITEGKKVKVIDTTFVPNWFIKYLVD